MDALKKLDAGIARGEGAIAGVILISMIVVASIQAFLRNLTYFDLSWANDALRTFSWADQFLMKGTLWLAFLGASLATRDERHIAIDVLPKLLPDKGKKIVAGLVGIASGIIAFFLARAFWSAVLVNALERPVAYEVFAATGAVHVCDASAADIETARLVAPTFFCGVRDALATIGAPVETPQAALQLVVPAAFVMISIRLFANGIHAFLEVGKPPKDEPNAIAKTAMHLEKHAEDLGAPKMEKATADTSDEKAED